MNSQHILILYSTATCNLQCKYCYIDKNPALVEIDKLLDESFQHDYYFNFAKKVFPNPSQLKEIQIWGGEPTLRLDRTYSTIKQLIEYYPNISTFKLSSNMTMDNFIDQFYGFLRILGEYSNRNFTFELQMSLDGPQYINDENRGIGVTEKFTKNFMKMVTTIEKEILNKYQNITLEIHFKQTLDNDSIKYLQSKENIINYYKFFEIYNNFCRNIKNNRFIFLLTVPNTACPLPHTKEDGILFANLIKLCRQIEEENKYKNYFNYYKIITPFSHGDGRMDDCNKGNCGSGKYAIGLLPNELLSMCHNGFVELISDYKKYCLTHNFKHSIDDNLFNYKTVKNSMIFEYKYLDKYLNIMQSFYDTKENFQFSLLYEYIIFLAENEQILHKYKKISEAKKAARFILTHTSYCMRDNLGVTGSKFIQPPGLIKLLLNGAMDYILGEKK